MRHRTATESSLRSARSSFFIGSLAFVALAGVAVAVVACAPGATPPAPEEAKATPTSDAPRLQEGLGDLHHPISSKVPLAQQYFDQGMVLMFGFNHDAAIRSFEEAARQDPSCAICYWGVALAHGPNINMPMGPDGAAAAYAALQQAQALASGASEAEQAYIAALATRYTAEHAEDRSALDLAYANAMGEVHRAAPDDLDAATLYAEALMDLTPWNYWTKEAEPRERTEELVLLLEDVAGKNPAHVGANHLYIHAVEEYYPEKAVAAADRLGALAPDAGHLVHMPSHIYWRVGRYQDALEINQKAIAADEAFFSWCRAGAFYRALYYPHNIHFLWAAASAEGQSEIALTAARKLAARTKDGLAEMPFLQEFQSIPILTLARFGRWDAVLGEPRPDPGEVYLVGISHYARGLAMVRTGRLDDASTELSQLAVVADRPDAHELILAGGTAPASAMLSIGVAHLEGELAAARGDADAAVSALERAVSLQDSLVYMEPPPWYFPTRQALGAVLLDNGRAMDAEKVYREDLLHYPSNGWSLYGLGRSLNEQGKAAEADWAEKGFQTAFARADVELGASRF